MGCTTSASSKKVVVFDQLRATTLKWRRSCETFSTSTLVKGHGPAMQEALGLRNSFPSPASRDNNPTAAFHLPSGEHSGCLLHGAFPVLTTSKVFIALPMFASACALPEYMRRVF